MDFGKQDAVLANILSEIKSGQLPHTFVIEGKDEASRQEAAAICAAALVCECEDKSTLPCGECTACRKIFAKRHPDVTVLSSAGGEQVRVDDVRRVRADAYATPFEADNKIVIFREAQLFNVQSQNALLKILEEPPQRVYFILTCPAANMLLPTVNSRCAKFSLGSLGKEEIYRSVSELCKAEDEQTKHRYSSLIAMLEGFEMTEKNIAHLPLALKICDEFYESGKFPFSLLPTKKEDTEDLKLIFKALALCALEITKVKKGAEAQGGVLCRRVLSSAAARLSLRSAFSQHELFCTVLERLEASANLGAVMALLRAELSE